MYNAIQVTPVAQQSNTDQQSFVPQHTIANGAEYALSNKAKNDHANGGRDPGVSVHTCVVVV